MWKKTSIDAIYLLSYDQKVQNVVAYVWIIQRCFTVKNMYFDLFSFWIRAGAASFTIYRPFGYIFTDDDPVGATKS